MQNFKTWNEIPEELKTALRWSGGIHSAGDKMPIRFSCAGWSVENGILKLAGALLDTSERFQGITVEPSITFHREAYFGGGAAFFHIHPIESSDSEETGLTRLDTIPS